VAAAIAIGEVAATGAAEGIGVAVVVATDAAAIAAKSEPSRRQILLEGFCSRWIIRLQRELADLETGFLRAKGSSPFGK
jgi:hypothetical protein